MYVCSTLTAKIFLIRSIHTDVCYDLERFLQTNFLANILSQVRF